MEGKNNKIELMVGICFIIMLLYTTYNVGIIKKKVVNIEQMLQTQITIEKVKSRLKK